MNHLLTLVSIIDISFTLWVITEQWAIFQRLVFMNKSNHQQMITTHQVQICSVENQQHRTWGTEQRDDMREKCSAKSCFAKLKEKLNEKTGPPGAIRIMVKTCFFLTAGGVFSFYYWCEPRRSRNSQQFTYNKNNATKYCTKCIEFANGPASSLPAHKCFLSLLVSLLERVYTYRHRIKANIVPHEATSGRLEWFFFFGLVTRSISGLPYHHVVWLIEGHHRTKHVCFEYSCRNRAK